MSKEHMKAETRFDDLTGAVSLNFKDQENFKSFAASVANLDLNKFEPIGLRAYFHHETIITIYAIEKALEEEFRLKKGKLPVHKLKADITLNELFSKIKQLDFTLIQNVYNVEDFEVVN